MGVYKLYIRPIPIFIGAFSNLASDMETKPFEAKNDDEATRIVRRGAEWPQDWLSAQLLRLELRKSWQRLWFPADEWQVVHSFPPPLRRRGVPSQKTNTVSFTPIILVVMLLAGILALLNDHGKEESR
jgi:hypothetical protein